MPTDSDRPRRIRPCRKTGACVSTVAAGAGRRTEPIPYLGRLSPAQDLLREVILALPRSTIVTDEPCYFRAVFRSAVFGFVDVAEFELVPRGADGGTIHFRSRARNSLYDFGVNRRRMEEIRRRFADQAPTG